MSGCPDSTTHFGNPAGDRRGIVLILVLVVLLLIVMLGLTYMTVARMDRVATSSIAATHGKQMLSMAIQHVTARLRDDLVGENDVYLDGEARGENYPDSGGKYPIPNFDDRWDAVRMYYPMTDEPYDYPWSRDPYQGQNDDDWLADLVPVLSGVAGEWRHTSNFRLLYPAVNGDFTLGESEFLGEIGTRDTPTLLTTLDNRNLNILDVDGDGAADWDPSIPDANRDGILDFEVAAADADGDGIPDSRWQYMPIRQIGDARYIWAVRVVDLSGKANVNIGTALTDGTGAYQNAQYPRMDNPAELDLGLLFGDTAFVGSAWGRSELASLLDSRLGTSAMPTPRTDRMDFWNNAGRRPTNPTGSFTMLDIDSELDLLYRNGLNYDRQMTQLETSLNPTGSSWLRSNSDGEREWRALSGVFTIREYFEKNPRLYLTTFSGSSSVTGLPRIPETYRYVTSGATRYDGYILQGRDEMRADQFGDFLQAKRSLFYYSNDVELMAWQFRKVFERSQTLWGPRGSGVTSSNWDGFPYGFAYNALPYDLRRKNEKDYAMRREMAGRLMAAAIVDYLDDDGGATRVTVSHPYAHLANAYNDENAHRREGTYTNGYSMATYAVERMPYIVESWAHWPFRCQSTTLLNGTDEWRADFSGRRTAGGDWGPWAGYVIEIKNPHNERISLDGVFLRMTHVNSSGWEPPTASTPPAYSDSWGGFDNTTTPGSGNKWLLNLGNQLQADYGTTFLAPGESLYIYRRPPALATQDILSLHGINSSTSKVISFSTGAFDVAGGAGTRRFAYLEMFVQGQDERIVKWPYQRVCFPVQFKSRGAWFSDLVFHYDDPSTPGADDPDGEMFYIAQNVVGNGNGLNALAMMRPKFSGTRWNNDGTGISFDNTPTDRFRSHSTYDWAGNNHLPIHPQFSLASSGGSRIELWNRSAFGRQDKTTNRNGDANWGPPDVERDLDNDGNLERLADEVWPTGGYSDGRPRRPLEHLQAMMLGPQTPEPKNTAMSTSYKDVAGVFRSQTFGGGGNPTTAPSFLEHFMLAIDAPQLQSSSTGFNDYWRQDWYDSSQLAWLLDRVDMLSPADDGVDNNGDGFRDETLTTDSDTDGDGLRGEEAPDGFDNDGDGVIDEDDVYDDHELFVPGRLNLNTVPNEVLRRVLPIPDTTRRNLVADRIINFRDNPDVSGTPWRELPRASGGGGLPTDYRDEPGIVKIGELIHVLDDILGADGVDDADLNGIRIDDDGPDGRIDDREERLRVANWLMNTCSVRSDTFAAYILLRGYRTAEFHRAPVDERRVIVIFDRSDVVGRFGQVRIRAMLDITED